ncbi:OLC1v1030453C1 [Oldenlandia corymbosa var. corymbosa]|uniref:OLC1v1030453C1 n=1 Tax=Oldenlandia corymbosa var. corymbosa TaxID=529605 RepID=A0AAV1CGU5_OLDCO|nr:OLC1v1030453C1 [Oldenlandia corymbosa var. corymbosa]
MALSSYNPDNLCGKLSGFVAVARKVYGADGEGGSGGDGESGGDGYGPEEVPEVLQQLGDALIKREIAVIKQENLPVTHYYGKLKQLRDRLGQIRPDVNCEGAVKSLFDASKSPQYLLGATDALNVIRKLIDDRATEDKSMEFMMGLSEVFEAEKNQILMIDPIPNVHRIYSMILKAEKTHQVSINVAAGTENSAMINKGGGWKSNNRPRNNQKKDKDPVLIGYPEGWNSDKRKGSGTHNVHLVDTPLEVTETDDNEWNGKIAAAVQKEINHLMKNKAPVDVTNHVNFSHIEDFAGSSVLPLVSSKSVFKMGNSWFMFVDTGATGHMNGSLHLLSNPQLVKSFTPVCLPDGSVESVSHDLQTTSILAVGKVVKGLYVLNAYSFTSQAIQESQTLYASFSDTSVVLSKTSLPVEDSLPDDPCSVNPLSDNVPISTVTLSSFPETEHISSSPPLSFSSPMHTTSLPSPPPVDGDEVSQMLEVAEIVTTPVAPSSAAGTSLIIGFTISGVEKLAVESETCQPASEGEPQKNCSTRAELLLGGGGESTARRRKLQLVYNILPCKELQCSGQKIQTDSFFGRCIEEVERSASTLMTLEEANGCCRAATVKELEILPRAARDGVNIRPPQVNQEAVPILDIPLDMHDEL